MSKLTTPVGPKDHIQGNANAPIVLVEYGDYQCPHCGRAYPIVKQVQERFGTRLAFVFRNFPLKEIHKLAESAAESTEFASEHNRFWEMHDAIFENQADLSLPMLLELTKSLGLSANELEAALSGEQYTPHVRGDFVGGIRSGVNGTPTFFINGQRHDGPFEFEDLVAAIETALG